MTDPALPTDLWKAISTAQRQSALYGRDHPNTLEAFGALTAVFQTLLSETTQTACLFSNDQVIVNTAILELTPEAVRLSDRLRERGCMGFTASSALEDREIQAFLDFLNTSPAEIRLAGGPAAWMGQASVASLTLTPAIYASGAEGTAEQDGNFEHQDFGSVNTVDAAVAAVVSRLAQADDQEWQDFKSLTSIFSDPDKGLALITGAVEALQNDNRAGIPAEGVERVIAHLKDLARQDPQDWDSALPELRRTVASLPEDLRPVTCALRPHFAEIEAFQTSEGGAEVLVCDVEEQISQALNSVAEGAAPDPLALECFFDLQLEGLPAAWDRERKPASHLAASANTFSHLLSLERNATEHATIAETLAGLIRPALETGGAKLALDVIQSLLSNGGPSSESHWRTINTRTAIRSIDSDILCSIIEGGINERSYQGLEVARALLQHYPEIAGNLLHLLGNPSAEFLTDSLKKALVSTGESVVPDLGKLVRTAHGSSRDLAFQILLDMPSPSARQEVLDVLRGTDPLFVLHWVAAKPSIDISTVNFLCLEALQSSSVLVRCAALEALGRDGNNGVVSAIAPFLAQGLFRGPTDQEKIAACHCLGAIGGEEAHNLLQQVVERRALLGRRRYEFVRQAAQQALAALAHPADRIDKAA
ncbi:MAG: HEAT repeat domain-containing protein [Armatimonadetes bacterium]|nr:HEAT repeat domain-containing protein [Armatimonadota bacterium]